MEATFTAQLREVVAAASPEWFALAACRDEPCDDWFAFDAIPGWERRQARALAVCAGCPVRDRCYDYAVENGLHFGVWGGTTETQRRRMRKALTRGSRATRVSR